ncbi:hypothetical protein JTB14_016808 [Gonioctena quinquepunctata]|nr:hypothetical protein JTB14_016808 [Gonioctena quinquepunctata]
MALGIIARSLWLLLSLTTLTSAVRQNRHVAPLYEQETAYPSSRNFFEGAISFDAHPVSVSAGFHVNPPPILRLPFLPPLPLAGLDFPTHPASFKRPPFLPVSLFTPNTVEQTAETKGQIEEYEKALREEALEKEQEQDRAYSGGQFSESGDLERTTQATHFVSVKSREYNYNYSV